MTAEQSLEDFAARGVAFTWHARQRRDDIAVIEDDGATTFGELDDRANQLSRALAAAGLRPGDAVAAVLSNRIEFIEVLLACLRSGLRLTPVNYRMGAGFVRHIVKDCDARAVIAETATAGLLNDLTPGLRIALCAGGGASGWSDYRTAIGAESPASLDEPRHGKLMLYTSGTSGAPKGVFRKGVRSYLRNPLPDMNPMDTHLLCGPAFHSAPLYHDLIVPLTYGRRILIMTRFDAREVLALIQRHRVTHTHMAPILFERLLALPQEVRSAYDLSSLKKVIHGGAPTAVETKRAMIDWFGLILDEYYAATEITAGIRITSEEWLLRPGSVGRIPAAGTVSIRRADGGPCAAGENGEVHFVVPEGDQRPVYYKDPEQTGRVFGAATFTLGDIGHVDDDSYLFLVGRAADRIISGGVTIHPLEIDVVLEAHPMVRSACAFGAPDREWGEIVVAAVMPHDDIDPRQLRDELHSYCREHLSALKRPKIIHIAQTLPVTASGKLRRQEVRNLYTRGPAKDETVDQPMCSGAA